MTRKFDRRHQRTLPRHELAEQVAALTREWDVSSQKKDLIDTIKDLLHPDNALFIDNALCLGLGSMETAELRPLPAWTEGPGPATDEVAESQGGKQLAPVGNAEKRNSSLYQLLVFETALDSLRERFTIGSVRFQDPSFTTADRQFLESRGHVVLEWNTDIPKVSGGYAMDPSLLGYATKSTMCYLPFLDDTTTVEVVCSVRPSLYFGMNLIATTVKRSLHSSKQTKDLMDDYSKLVLASDFKSIKAFGGIEPEDFGFMWPVNATGSQETKAELERRNERILSAAVDFQTELHRQLAQMKLERGRDQVARRN